MTVEVGVATRPCAGETEIGDCGLVLETDRRWLLVLADGLGHGPAAAHAARIACETARSAPSLELLRMMQRCDAALRGTRGAAVTIVRLDPEAGTFAHTAVGNVELVLLSGSGRSRPLTRPGIVGMGLRNVSAATYPLAKGDLFAVFTDGISSRLDLNEFASLPAQEIASALLERHGKSHDDATCIVART